VTHKATGVIAKKEAAEFIEARETRTNYNSRLVARCGQGQADIRSHSPACDIEVITIVCSVAACLRWPLGYGYLDNVFCNAGEMRRILILSLPMNGLPDKKIHSEIYCLNANVPIYSARGAGTGFWNKLK